MTAARLPALGWGLATRAMFDHIPKIGFGWSHLSTKFRFSYKD